MKFTVEVDLSGAAFAGYDESFDESELVRLLDIVVYSVQDGNCSGGSLMDYNGNTVGSFTFTE